MQLSDRLNLVADFVTEGLKLADIGTDHGYIPIELVKRGVVPSALAMDINKGPLARADEHIKEAGLSDKIQTRLSDGLNKLEKNEADSIIIAGMGGALTVKILDQGKDILDSVQELILSPHTESYLVREYLINNGFEIVKEAMIYDMGKYYTVIKAVHTDNSDIKQEYDADVYNYIYGKLLLEEKNQVFMEYIRYDMNKQKSILLNMKKGNVAIEKQKEVQEKIEYIETILAMEG